MKEETYLFYDLETTGLNPCFDQIVQFSAIRTDRYFNPIEDKKSRAEEVYNFYVALSLDTIPSAKAFSTTCIPAEKLVVGNKINGIEVISEYEAIHRIYELAKDPYTIMIGYNSNSFDNEFLRFSFYRYLLPAYSHEEELWNNPSKIDLYPMVLFYYLFQKNSLQWPVVKGKKSFKLEHLKEKNDLASGQAHDSIVDVRASIALAKKLRESGEDWEHFFHYLASHYIKDDERSRLNKLSKFENTDRRIGIALSPNIKREDIFHHTQVLELGRTKEEQTVWLPLEQENLIQICEEGDFDHIKTLRKKKGGMPFIFPLKDTFLREMKHDQLEMIEKNKEYLIAHPEHLETIQSIHADNFSYAAIQNLDAQSQLYAMRNYFEEFIQSDFSRFHKSIEMYFVKELPFDLNRVYFPKPEEFLKDMDEDLKVIALRMLGRNFYDKLTGETRKQFDRYLRTEIHQANKVFDYKGKNPRKTPAIALLEVYEELNSNTLSFKQKDSLRQLENHIRKQFFERFYSEDLDLLIDNTSRLCFAKRLIDSEDCIYSEILNMTRREALKFLTERLELSDLYDALLPAMEEVLLENKFIAYLKSNSSNFSELSEIFERYDAARKDKSVNRTELKEAKNAIYKEAKKHDEILKHYVLYDVRDYGVNEGWSHPSVLIFLAKNQGKYLQFWELHENKLHKGKSYSEYVADETPEVINLLLEDSKQISHLKKLSLIESEQMFVKVREENLQLRQGLTLMHDDKKLLLENSRERNQLQDQLFEKEYELENLQEKNQRLNKRLQSLEADSSEKIVDLTNELTLYKEKYGLIRDDSQESMGDSETIEENKRKRKLNETTDVEQPEENPVKKKRKVQEERRSDAEAISSLGLLSEKGKADNSFNDNDQPRLTKN